MQTMENRPGTIAPPTEASDQLLAVSEPKTRLKAVYRQLFKENRDLDFFHSANTDSAYINGQLTTRELVYQLLTSEMYRDYILSVNSNYRFVSLTFERVLGRPATESEQRAWSSLLATEGLEGFARKLVDSDEYVTAFGDDKVPTRRSQKLSSSSQGIPALSEMASTQRYDGAGRINQFSGGDQSLWGWEGSLPPEKVRKAGAVLAVAGTLEVIRVLLIIISSALSTRL